MSEDWNAVAVDVALGLLEAGRTAYIVRRGAKSGPDYDPSYDPDDELECTAVFVGWEHGEIDGTLILSTDKKVLIAAGGVVPTVADRFASIASGDTAEIVSIQPLAPAGVAVLYTIQIRS